VIELGFEINLESDDIVVGFVTIPKIWLTNP
jgi:hypothetical protein